MEYIHKNQIQLEVTINKSYNLKPHNTFGIDVCADYFIEYNSENQLIEILKSEEYKGREFLHIGEGSNLLFTTSTVGIVLHSQIKHINIQSEQEETIQLNIGAGMNWDDVCAYAVEKAYWGIENLSNIPGETGAAAVQNIGAYGVEVCDVIKSVRAYDLHSQTFVDIEKNDCEYGYRTSLFKSRQKGRFIVTELTIELQKNGTPKLNYSGLRDCFEKNTTPTLNEIRAQIIKVRDFKLPKVGEVGSAGSFFKNPVVERQVFEQLHQQYSTMPHYENPDETVKIPAGWLIDQCGLKGTEHKGAKVYEKQALVIINTGTANGQSIVELSQIVQTAVKQKFNINLEPEVQFI